MEKIRTAVLIVQLTASGCGIIPWNFQGEESQDPVPQIAATEIEPGIAKTPATPDPAVEKSKPAMRNAPQSASPLEIRRLQEVLKVTGFDAGPIDGIFGSRTRDAFLELKSGCTAMGDLPAQISGDRAKIRTLQSRLKYAGFDPGPVDGVAGPNTQAAVVRYQTGCTAYKNFSPSILALVNDTGVENNECARLNQRCSLDNVPRSAKSKELERPKVTAEKTETHGTEEVRALQLRLKKAGFDPGPIDGIMGPKTELALKTFQDSQEATKSQVSAPASNRALVY